MGLGLDYKRGPGGGRGGEGGAFELCLKTKNGESATFPRICKD